MAILRPFPFDSTALHGQPEVIGGMMRGLALTLLLIGAFAARPALAHVNVPGLDVNGQCVGDADSDATVAINELITAVNNALNGCARLPVTLNFRGMIGDQPFACGTIFNNVGSGASEFIASDFRFYISNVRLLTVGGSEVPVELEDDGVWQYTDPDSHKSVALLDFETGPGNGCPEGNTATNTAVHGTVPAGVYTGVRFDLGVPFELDHLDVSTARSPLNFTAMYWSWNQGYKFLRIDTGDGKFLFHLGSSGCDGATPSRPPTTCSRPNLPTITLPSFNITHSVVVADIAALLADSNIDVNQPGTVPGCQSDADDQDCVPLFHNLGLNFPEGTVGTTPQKLFSVGLPAEEEHVEVKIASSADGSGQLIAHPEFDVTQPIPLPFAECLGGTGDECTGGTRIFSAANPGFEPIGEAEPGESLFKLADGVPVTLELTVLSDGLTFRSGDQVLDHVGATLVLGTTPDFHVDLEAQLTLPGGGEPSGTFEAGFKVTTTSSQYQSSDPIRVKFTPADTE